MVRNRVVLLRNDDHLLHTATIIIAKVIAKERNVDYVTSRKIIIIAGGREEGRICVQSLNYLLESRRSDLSYCRLASSH